MVLPDLGASVGRVVSSAKIRSPYLIRARICSAKGSSSKPILPIHCAHLRTVDLDAIARIDRFLAIERQAVGVFGHRDLRQ